MRDQIFIVGGGSSLKGQDLSWLADVDCIAVNYAVRFIPAPTYWLTADSGVIRNAVANKFWGLPANTHKVVVMQRQHPRYHAVKHLLREFDEWIEPTNYGQDPGKRNYGDIYLDKTGFATGKNTGFCALQYAVRLGYKKIYLLGFDMQKVEGKKYFYADSGGGESPFDVFYRHLVTGLRRLREAGVCVVSCSPVSPLNKHVAYLSIEEAKNVPRRTADIPA